MKIVSLNTGLPREVTWHGRSVTTGIYKSAVEGPVSLRRLNLDGDRQADLSVHGGTHKAVYCYPHEHYAWWMNELGAELQFGAFGENLTTHGLDETSVHIGDRFSIGTAAVVVTQPRLPCYKLGIKFQSDAMVKRFLASRRSGFYLAVQREGQVAAGNEMTRLERDPNGVSIRDIMHLYLKNTFGDADAAMARRAIEVPALPDSWKDQFRERLTAPGAR
jgi:MOSC domain-containing protein YiiM